MKTRKIIVNARKYKKKGRNIPSFEHLSMEEEELEDFIFPPSSSLIKKMVHRMELMGCVHFHCALS